MHWPDTQSSLDWMQSQGVATPQAQRMLKASGGRPEDAMAFAGSGRDPNVWNALPKAMARGETLFFKDWSPPQIIDALHKLCHDLMAIKTGAAPRFFDPVDLGRPPSMGVLSGWSKALASAMRTMDHPFNAGLMQEALVGQAKTALNSPH
jgi:DNA polymerase-3 subunit delta'